MTTIGLVGCASVKLQRPAPARELYRSSLFMKAAAYAERYCDRWYILSAKYGLIDPDSVIEPYNVRLGDRLTGPPIWRWAHSVNEQLDRELDVVDSPLLVVLAGEQYRSILNERECPWPVQVPMRGLGIGEQLAWLTRELAEPAPVDLQAVTG